jgi:hypothetical protein
MDQNEDAEVQAVARWFAKLPKSFGECFIKFDTVAGTASFDEQSSLMSVSSEEGRLLGSKVVPRPEIGSEFEFEEFLVTVEGERSALEDVTNRIIPQPSIHYNSSNANKHTQQPLSQQDVGLAAGNTPEGQSEAKFLVAFTRCGQPAFALNLAND